jgi:catechol 2,3-dioxygenase-like lactoylglutathione lyase family enzyme
MTSDNDTTAILSTVQWLSVCISVSSLDESVSWYTEQLGFEQVLRQDFPELSAGLAYLRHGDLVIELVESSPSAGVERPAPPRHALVRGITQLTLYVPDAHRALEQVKAKGLPIVMDLVEVPVTGVTAFFSQDPDGNLIEFHQADWALRDAS